MFHSSHGSSNYVLCVQLTEKKVPLHNILLTTALVQPDALRTLSSLTRCENDNNDSDNNDNSSDDKNNDNYNDNNDNNKDISDDNDHM